MKTLFITTFIALTCAIHAINASAQVTILSVGDSITSGLKLNASRTSWYCPPTNVLTSSTYICNGGGVLNKGGFQPDVKTLLAQQGINAAIYNWGFAGEESWELVNRVNQAMNSRAADMVFILAGVNDLNDNVSDQTTAFNVAMMMDNVKNRGLTPIVGMITPHLGVHWYNRKIMRINYIIRNDAKEKKVAVAEHFQALIGNWGAYHSGDGLHVNNTGDAVMANEWLKAYNNSKTLSFTITPILQLLLD